MLILMSYVCVYCRIHVNKLLSIYKLGRTVTSYLVQFLIPHNEPSLQKETKGQPCI